MSETTAKEIMTRDLIYATDDMTIESALKILINNRITGLPVVDNNGKIKGVISEYDILDQIAKSKIANADIFQQVIIYSKKIKTIRIDAPLSKIVREFIETKYRRMPVINKGGKLVGIITRRDLMRVYYYRARLAD